MMLLASVLRAIESEVAPDGLRERSFNADAISDDFALAEALIRPEAIAAALRALGRSELALLRLVAEGRGSRDDIADALGPPAAAAITTCLRRFLVLESGNNLVPIPEVTDALDAVGVPPLSGLLSPERPAAIVEHGIDTALLDRRAAETATRTISAVSGLLSTLATQPARELAKGGLSLPDTKRIAERARIELLDVERVHRLATLAGLSLCDGRTWYAAAESTEWLNSSLAQRWVRLATALWIAAPVELREAAALLASEAPRAETTRSRWVELLHWQYPALEHPTEMVTAFLISAEPLGLTVSSELSSIGRGLAANEAPELLFERAERFLPPETSQLYVQPDCSIVVPGPPTPEMDRMLRSFADCEQVDLASTYRVSAASINRALAEGSSLAEFRSFLTDVSLTGVPQPVEFLLTQAAEQFGRVRVRTYDEPPIQTAVRSLDPHLIEVLLVDQSVQALAFQRRGDELVSRADVTNTLLSLDAARYPAALENEHGDIVPMRPHLAGAPDPRAAGDPVEAMWQRVRAQRSGRDDAGAWLSRQIEIAVKARARLLVEVQLPGGGSTEYLLEPTGIAGNRLRARDRRADIERTLPLSSIITVTPA